MIEWLITPSQLTSSGYTILCIQCVFDGYAPVTTVHANATQFLLCNCLGLRPSVRGRKPHDVNTYNNNRKLYKACAGLAMVQVVYSHSALTPPTILTYLLNPLRAGSHIRPTPKNANVACPLQASSPGPNSTREPSSPAQLISSTSPWVSPSLSCHQGSSVSGILQTCLIHFHLRRLTSREMGCIPVLSWSSVLEILFGQYIRSIGVRKKATQYKYLLNSVII